MDFVKLVMWLALLGALIFVGERIFGKTKNAVEKAVARQL